MKIAVSMPDELFKAGESLASRMGLSRSGLYAAALEEYIARHQARRVSERLDAVYGVDSSGVDVDVARVQRKALRKSDW